MGLERIALISDVHGNLTALEAVLADIDARGIDADLQPRRLRRQGPARPRGGRPVPGALRGEHPRQLGRLPARPRPRLRQRGPALVAAPARAGAGGVAALAAVLPRLHDERPPDPALPRLGGDRAPAGPLRPRRGGVPRRCSPTPPATGDGPVPDVVGYADTHDPYYETDRERRTVFNTGSVGNCMDDPTPVYVILEGVMDGPDEAPFSIQFVRVPYDGEAELAVAAATGHARARGLHRRRSATASTAATSRPARSRTTTGVRPGWACERRPGPAAARGTDRRRLHLRRRGRGPRPAGAGRALSQRDGPRAATYVGRVAGRGAHPAVPAPTPVAAGAGRGGAAGAGRPARARRACSSAASARSPPGSTYAPTPRTTRTSGWSAT